jgi:hypothetical protein
MTLHNETAAPMTPIIVNGGSDSSIGLATQNYRISPENTTEFAIRLVARRYRLTPSFARTVCNLAGIGGAL